MTQSDKTLDKKKIWIIRAGRQAEIVDEFVEKSVVAVGWAELNDLPMKDNWESFRTEVRNRLGNASNWQVGSAAGQLWAFMHEIKLGDWVVTPDRHTRQVFVGKVQGEYRYDPAFNPNYPRTRLVKWLAPLDWDSLPVRQTNSFTAWQTIHQPESDFGPVIELAEHPKKSVNALSPLSASDREAELAREDLSERAQELITARLQSIHL
jgi:restriction system protein